MSVELGESPVIADTDYRDRPATDLAKKSAQLFSEFEIRLEPRVLFGRDRRQVDRVARDSIAQIVAHLLRNAQADDLLRLLGRAGDVRRGDHMGMSGESPVAGRLGFKDVERRTR